MSDDENFETTESGASNTVPTPCGDLKKGGYAMLKGYPCKVQPSSVILSKAFCLDYGNDHCQDW